MAAARRKLAQEIPDIVSDCEKDRGAERMASPLYAAEHEAYREVVRRFVEKEIEPYAHEWDEAGGFPRVPYEKAADIGLLGLGFPEEYGGTEVKNFTCVVAAPGPPPPGATAGTPSLQRQFTPPPPTPAVT